MRINEVSHDELDRLIYNDYFDNKDAAFSVMLHNKVWKSFPTYNRAKLAADNYNLKHKKELASVIEN